MQVYYRRGGLPAKSGVAAHYHRRRHLAGAAVPDAGEVGASFVWQHLDSRHPHLVSPAARLPVAGFDAAPSPFSLFS